MLQVHQVKFAGVGEHLDDIDVFDAKRVAGQILGMGDIVKLVRESPCCYK